MDGKLLARNILCALGTGVIINLSFATTAHASENQNEYTGQPAVVDDSAQQTKQQQLERIRQISQEIADINARLSQLTEELNRYNEQLNNTQVETNPQIDIDNVESFNENRQLKKTSKISQENRQDIQDDFASVKDVAELGSDIKTVQSAGTVAETKKNEPIRITSEQIHRNNQILLPEKTTGTAINSVNKEGQTEKVEQKDRYIAENREAAINSERRNITFNYDENGFKINHLTDNHSMMDTERAELGINSKQTHEVMSSAETGGNTVRKNNINENKNVVFDTERQSVLPGRISSEYKIDEFSEKPAQKIENKQILTADTKANGTDYNLQQSGRKYISSADILRNRNISKAQQRSGVQIERNEDVITENEDNVIDFKKITMLDRFNASAPSWTYEYFSNLDKAGLLYPDKDFNLNNLSRREGAILTARSYNLYKIQSRRNQYATNGSNEYNKDTIIINDINVLMKEFAPEVKALGYDIISEVSDTDIAYTTDYNWKIGGEIRYNYAKNGGSPKYDWNESRVRARLYGKKALSDNWNVNVMLETDHNFLGNDDNLYSKSDDTDLDLSRIYVDGQMNWWDIPFYIELGKTYAYLGEGNVLDSDFEGLKIAANPDPNTLYSAGYGQVNDTEDMFYLEAYHKNRQYDYLAGFYRWDNYGNPANIYALGMNYYTGDFKLGGMYLKSDLADGSGAQDGYVLSARYKEVFPWIPNTYEFDLKYYNMAGNTYINHTMNGVGSYMDGFSGWGAMAYYTLAENWLLGLEYYDLKDKTTGEDGKTAWVQLSWFF